MTIQCRLALPQFFDMDEPWDHEVFCIGIFAASILGAAVANHGFHDGAGGRQILWWNAEGTDDEDHEGILIRETHGCGRARKAKKGLPTIATSLENPWDFAQSPAFEDARDEVEEAEPAGCLFSSQRWTSNQMASSS